MYLENQMAPSFGWAGQRFLESTQCFGRSPAKSPKQKDGEGLWFLLAELYPS